MPDTDVRERERERERERKDSFPLSLHSIVLLANDPDLFRVSMCFHVTDRVNLLLFFSVSLISCILFFNLLIPIVFDSCLLRRTKGKESNL